MVGTGAAMTPRVGLHANFWGTHVAMLVEHGADEKRLRYYFQDYLVDDHHDVDWEVLLRSTEGAFIGGDSDQSSTVWVRRPGQAWALYDGGRHGLRHATAIPPFSLPPLSGQVRTLHASAASPPWSPDHALVLHGQSTAGKSSLLLALLQRGWSFITDDTAVIDSDSMLLRYFRPIGIRERLFTANPWLANHVDHAPTFDTPTGVTHAVHPRDLGVPLAPERTTWQWTVQMTPGEDFHTDILGPQTMRLQFSVDNHLPQAVDAIESWTRRTGSSDDDR